MKTLLQNLWEKLYTHYTSFLESAPTIIIALFVTSLFFWISKIVRKRIVSYLKTKAADPLQVNFLSDIFRFINIIIGIILFLSLIGKQSIVASILGAGAVSAFVIGFAFKDIGENFLAGVILAFKRPFRIGDTVMINSIVGSIMDLSFRETHMKTFEGKDVYIPNAIIIKNPLFNYTIDGFLRQEFTLGFDYGLDIPMARTILLDCINTIPGVLQKDKLAKTMVVDAGLHKINICVQYWINTYDNQYSGTEIKSLAIHSSLEELKKNGIVVTSQKVGLIDNPLQQN
ncbi:MAG: mechanosensitive ion channel [Saprospiraceae bacterium]|nr:mechanosensitive ion channel [Saprospiraceae bacterium]